MKSKVLFIVVLNFLFLCSIVFAQQTLPTPEATKDFWSNLDATTKAIAGVVGLITTILGVPVAYLLIKKTKVEIRKGELEAKQLESNLVGNVGSGEVGHQIRIHDSDHINIQILADPRFLGPLLLLLDFIIAFIAIYFADYIFGLFGLRFLSIGIAILLFIPILREASRVKKVLLSLRPKDENSEKDKE